MPPEIKPIREAKRAFERDYLLALLDATGGNVLHAARLAQIDRANAYVLIRKHGIDLEACRTSADARRQVSSGPLSGSPVGSPSARDQPSTSDES